MQEDPTSIGGTSPVPRAFLMTLSASLTLCQVGKLNAWEGLSSREMIVSGLPEGLQRERLVSPLTEASLLHPILQGTLWVH